MHGGRVMVRSGKRLLEFQSGNRAEVVGEGWGDRSLYCFSSRANKKKKAGA